MVFERYPELREQLYGLFVQSGMTRIQQMDWTKPEKILAVAEGIRLVLSDPKRWTTGTSARNADIPFERVDPMSSHATCWCIQGARIAVLGILGHRDPYDRAQTEFLHALMARRRDQYKNDGATYHFHDVNDYIGYPAVIEMLDGIIEALKEEIAA